MIGLCVDSGAQLPPGLIARFAVEVVPVTVTVDGVDHFEGVDLDADGFYRSFEDGRQPAVATAAPSPGRFLVAYDALAARGADEILSVHTGSAVSATFDSARVAAGEAPVPVRLVDTGVASFMVACAALAAAESLARGSSIAEAETAALEVAGSCGNVFVVGTLDLARAGGRLQADAGTATAAGIPVLALEGGQLRTVGHAADLDQAVELLGDDILAAGPGLRVGVGDSDPSSVPLADALEARLTADAGVVDVIRYRVGPSIGAHTGPGTAGAVFHRLPGA